MGEHLVSLHLDLSDDDEAALTALARRARKDVGDTVAAVAEAGAAELIRWLGGYDRPASISEQAMDRLRALVAAGLLPERPSPMAVAQQLRVSLARGRYLAAALSLERPAQSEALRRLLSRKLEDGLKASGVDLPKVDRRLPGLAALGAKYSSVRVDLERDVADELRAAYDETLRKLLESDPGVPLKNFPKPTIRNVSDTYATASLDPSSAVAVLLYLGAEI